MANGLPSAKFAPTLAQTSGYATAYEGRFSIKCLIQFHILQHWIADVKKKTSIPLDQVIKKSCDTVFNKSGNKRAEPPKFKINTSKVISSPPVKLLSPPMLLIWRSTCFYPTRPENTDENQPITNLKPQTFANTTGTSKKAKVFTGTLLFCSNLYDVTCWHFFGGV